MTSFSTPNIICCPKCGKFLQQRRLASFNDFGAVGWSDGYSSIFGLSAVSSLAHCPCCHGVFWYDNAKKVGTLPRESRGMSSITRLMLKITGDKRGDLEKVRAWNETPLEWKSAPNAEVPSFQDLLAALEDRASLTPGREMIVRRKIWWEGNDHLRHNHDETRWQTKAVLIEEAVKENLEAMLCLHASFSEPDTIEKAELLRELGRFDESIALLDCFDNKTWEVDDRRRLQVAKILACARNNDARVSEVWRSEYTF